MHGRTVLLEMYYILLKVAFLDCSNAVSFLSSCLNEKGLSSCQNATKNLSKQLSFQMLQDIFKQ
jgi:hypothetical protein